LKKEYRYLSLNAPKSIVRRALQLSVTLLSLMALQPAQAVDLREVSNAVVKLFITVQTWNMRQPWSKNPSRRQVCSGFLIEQGIVTNAHCVSDATYIQMEVPGGRDKVEVEIKAVSHQIDLALLQPKDTGVFAGVKPISFGDLPKLREKVVTVGYPTGGRQVSFTEGVVSRIDMMGYVHSRLGNLMVQTDAAINGGNSGGPVFSDRTGECLGVATQKGAGSAIGYFIPIPVVKLFIKDIRDGRVDGVPALGVFIQGMENPAERALLGMPGKLSGVRIKKVARYGSAHGFLRENDVLLSIEGHPIFNDGRVRFRAHGKIGFGYYFSTKQIGEDITFEVWRDRQRRKITFQLKPRDFMVIPAMPQYDTQPRFYLLGGLLFRVVEPRYLGHRAPVDIKKYYQTTRGEQGLQELVVIGAIYEASVNKGYNGGLKNIRVMRVNGRKIGGLKDLVAAFKAGAEREFYVIDLEGRAQVILNRKQVESSEAAIRKRYNIRI